CIAMSIQYFRVIKCGSVFQQVFVEGFFLPWRVASSTQALSIITRSKRGSTSMTPYPYFTVLFTIPVNGSRFPTGVLGGEVQGDRSMDGKGEGRRVKRQLVDRDGEEEAEQTVAKGKNMWYRWALYTARTVRPGKSV